VFPEGTAIDRKKGESQLRRISSLGPELNKPSLPQRDDARKLTLPQPNRRIVGSSSKHRSFRVPGHALKKINFGQLYNPSSKGRWRKEGGGRNLEEEERKEGEVELTVTSSGPCKLVKNSQVAQSVFPTLLHIRTRPSIPPVATSSPSEPGKRAKKETKRKGRKEGNQSAFFFLLPPFFPRALPTAILLYLVEGWTY